MCLRACEVTSVVCDCNPMDCSLPDSSAHGFSRQEYCSELPFPLPKDPLNPGIESMSSAAPALQVTL